MTPKIGSDGKVTSPCGRLRFFYDDYDFQPTFYSSVNTGLEISDSRGEVLADFRQSDWDASRPPSFDASGIAEVGVTHKNGVSLVLMLDIERSRFAIRPATTGPGSSVPAPGDPGATVSAAPIPDAQWHTGFVGIEPLMLAAATR